MKRCMSKVVVVVAMLVVVFAGQLYAEDTYKAPSITYSYSNGVFGIMVLGVNYGAVSDFLLDDVSIGETLAQMATQGQLVVYQYTDWFYIGIYATEEALAEFAGNNFQIALSEGTVLSKPLPEVSNLLPASEEASAKAADKANVCQCTDYVRLRKGLPKNGMGGAHTWDNGYLKNNGYNRVNGQPKKNDIVVYEKNYGSGIDTANGHVGIIDKNAIDDKKGNWRIDVRGANQGGNESETGCNNVSTLKNRTVSKAKVNKTISFWRK
ncbi:CHAP domain-containing protein [Candidatus Magnetobacterium casense]|uniref:CHAP domain-containing protein n=1 Tax=Candidatus Magnetobacterium casense TaxID=1455061 RepID=UPI00059126B7|nr:CHAP domain-containing protein [Candidatus Magnetobacterium casensis]